MKRLHLHIRVYDIESNIKFYSSLFALAPVARGPDCAQWILDTPQMTFTISERGSTMGLEHLGFQVDSAEELEAVRQRFASVDTDSTGEPPSVHADSTRDTHLLMDPQGILWAATRTSSRN